MGRSFDDLIGFLLDEIALCGEEGMAAIFVILCASLYRLQPTFLNIRLPCPICSTTILPRACKSLDAVNIA